jgi:calcineurin-like phosphoesterase family protein
MLKINGLKIVLFHYPVQTWDCKHHGSIHLYGHIHSNIGDHPMDYIIPNSYNVGVDVNNFEPISLEEVLIKLNYKTK